MPRPAAATFAGALLLAACTATDPAPLREPAAAEPPALPGATADAAAARTAAVPSWVEPVEDTGGDPARVPEYLRALQPLSLPEWAHSLAIRRGLTETLALAYHLNPFYQNGDFDGDGRLDLAVLVARRGSGELGILLLHSGTERSVLLGAGEEFGNGGPDFAWLTNWRVRPAAEASTGGDALEVIRAESASGLIYWTGDGYRWRQLAD